MRGIRNLLTWITILLVACSVPIFAVRVLRPTPTSTACIQLFAPFTSGVLTVDTTTGASLPDKRGKFPLTTTDPTNTFTSSFDDIAGQSQGNLEWSPDHQRLLATSLQQSIFTLMWWQRETHEVHQFQFPDRATDKTSADWLTNDYILLHHYIGEGWKLFRLDLRTKDLVELDSLPNSKEYFLDWHDDNYLAVSTRTNLTLYRLSDGTALFFDMAPSTGEIAFFVAPDERAALLFRERDSGFGRRNLSLVTERTRRIMSNADQFTLPAWAPDGESFAFALIERLKAGWTIRVMSRDGLFIRSFVLPTKTNSTDYEQIRWTNCIE